MPYDYKRSQDCRQKSGDKGAYVTKKTGAKEQKCWKSKASFERARSARHAKQGEVDEVTEEQLTEDLIRQTVRNILRDEMGL